MQNPFRLVPGGKNFLPWGNCFFSSFFQLKELQEKTGESSYTVVPDYVFEVGNHTKSSTEFDESAQQYGVKYGYHGSRMDNFYSIASNGLQVHLMKVRICMNWHNDDFGKVFDENIIFEFAYVI